MLLELQSAAPPVAELEGRGWTPLLETRTQAGLFGSFPDLLA